MLRGKPQGIDKRPKTISWNRNSGASAINLAYHLGAGRVILLGFDMKPNEDGELNWHRKHIEMGLNKEDAKRGQRIYNRFLVCFDMIERDAQLLGLPIINANPDSQISNFRKVPYERLLENTQAVAQ